MVATLDAADARFLALLTKSANRGLADAAETALAAIPVRFAVADVDLAKVGPKGYIHGWIFVGAHPSVGQAVHQVKKDSKGNVVSERHGHISRIGDGHVHVTWGDGKKNIVQHVHDDKHPGGLVERGKHEGGADHFSTALAAGTSANRRKNYDEAAGHFDTAAEHAPDEKTRADMKARAIVARAKAGNGHAAPAPAPAAKPPKAAKPRAPRKPKAPEPAAQTTTSHAEPLHHPPATHSPEATALRDRLRLKDPFTWSFGHAAFQVANPPDAEMQRLVDKLGPAAASRVALESDAENGLARMVQMGRPEELEDDDLPPVTAAELAQTKRDAEKQLKEDFAGKKVAIRTTPESLQRILADGRFKSLFETKKSGAKRYVPDRRRTAEEMMFGTPPDADPSTRPIYGYLAMNGVEHTPPDHDLLDTYGGVRVVLKDHVRSRTTASVGDTLDQGVLPSSIDDPSWESFNPSMHYKGLKMDYADMASGLYVDAQIHGGVSADDIERVAFPSQPSPQLQAALARRNIPWSVIGGGAGEG